MGRRTPGQTADGRSLVVGCALEKNADIGGPAWLPTGRARSRATRLCGGGPEHDLGVGLDGDPDGGRQVVPVHHQGSLRRSGRRLAHGVATDRRAGHDDGRPRRGVTP